jgi:NADPH-dependent ferric siderophore reductase
VTTTEVRTVEETPVEAPGWRFFETVVTGVRRLGPSTVRLTLGGPELAGFGVAGDDQRIKFVIPQPGGDVGDLVSHGGDWYPHYCAMADEVRPFVRTYTVRAARVDRAEIDVDVVLHGVDEGHAGPAAAWAAGAAPGDRLVVLGPDRPGTGRMWGVEWAPPATAHTLLLAADETAVPAVGAILEGLAVRWLPRSGRVRGELLVPAVHAALCDLGIASPERSGEVIEDVDLEAGLLWEVPDPDATAGCYAWLAGEAGVVKQLRRHLVTDLGVPRNEVAFMGYWRVGVSG